MGVEGTLITGHLVIRGLQDADLTGELEYEITAIPACGENSATKGKLHFPVIGNYNNIYNIMNCFFLQKRSRFCPEYINCYFYTKERIFK